MNLSGCELDGAWQKILDELNNCELLCKKHHLEYTRSQWANQELVQWDKGIRGEYLHGSARMYNDKGCRCEHCKLAKKYYRNGHIKFYDVIEV